MHLTPSTWWAWSFGGVFLVWLFFPGFRIPLSAVLVVQAGILVWGIAAIQSQFFGPVLCRNPSRPQAIALTFDDGPDPSLTPDVLDLLEKHRVKATFFVVAKRVKTHPEIVLRAWRAGHVIACHDLNHSVFSNFRSGNLLITQLGLAQSMIQSVINARPLLYRPPMGLLNPHILPAIAEFGMRCIGWSKSAGDGGNRRKKAIGLIGSLAAGGEVVLLHDILPKPALKGLYLENLRLLLESCAEKQLAIETIDRFFEVPPYSGAMDAKSQGLPC